MRRCVVRVLGTPWGITAGALLASTLMIGVAGAQVGTPTDPGTPRVEPPEEWPTGGPGEAAPWSVEGTPEPRYPWKFRRGQNQPSDESKHRRRSREVLCRILELEDLGRLYVEDISGHAGGDPYWVQLPAVVKLRAEDPRDFEGRRRLTLEDLDVGQLLIMSVRREDGEILKVKVRPGKS